MDATELPELRRQVHLAAEAYHDALSVYFDVISTGQPPPVMHAAAQRCHDLGAVYDTALGALIDALWFPLNDEAHAAEQRQLNERRALLAAELRLLT